MLNDHGAVWCWPVGYVNSGDAYCQPCFVCTHHVFIVLCALIMSTSTVANVTLYQTLSHLITAGSWAGGGAHTTRGGAGCDRSAGHVTGSASEGRTGPGGHG